MVAKSIVPGRARPGRTRRRWPAPPRPRRCRRGSGVSLNAKAATAADSFPGLPGRRGAPGFASKKDAEATATALPCPHTARTDSGVRCHHLHRRHRHGCSRRVGQCCHTTRAPRTPNHSAGQLFGALLVVITRRCHRTSCSENRSHPCGRVAAPASGVCQHAAQGDGSRRRVTHEGCWPQACCPAFARRGACRRGAAGSPARWLWPGPMAPGPARTPGLCHAHDRVRRGSATHAAHPLPLPRAAQRAGAPQPSAAAAPAVVVVSAAVSTAAQMAGAVASPAVEAAPAAPGRGGEWKAGRRGPCRSGRPPAPPRRHQRCRRGVSPGPR